MRWQSITKAERMYRSVLWAAAFFLCLDVLVLLLNFIISTQLSTSAQQINLAGRQRMLSQRMTKEMLGALLHKEQSLSIRTDIQALAKTHVLFDNTLKALTQGGKAVNTNDQTIDLSPVKEESAQKLLQKAQIIWQPIHLTLLQLEQQPNNKNLLDSAALQLQNNNLVLLKMMNQLTFEIEQSTYQRVQMMRGLQTAAIVLALLNFVVILRRLLSRLQRYNQRSEQQVLALAESNCQLQEARKAADAANHAKGVFLANISHELRTPMNGVIASLELLLAQSPVDAERQMLETAHYSARSLLFLLNDLLDLAKIDAGKLILEQKPIYLVEVISNVVSSLRPMAEAKGLILDYELDPKLPEAVLGDVLRLRQIIFNLLGNAIKFTQSSESVQGRIDIVAQLLPNPNPQQAQIQLMVRDNGIGMDSATVQRLFQPFVQADTTVTRRFGGTGLGLAICHYLVQLMGGSIQVHTEPQAGSEFVVSLLLPIVSLPARQTTRRARPEMRVAPSVAEAEVNGQLILVAEDNLVNQQVIQQQLAWLGYACIVAENGVEALRLWQQRKIGLLLTDCHMPEMDGFTLAQQVRRWEQQYHQQAMPIIAFTASALVSEADQCRHSGMNDVLVKPVDLAALEQALSKWLLKAPVKQQPIQEEPSVLAG